MAAHPVPGGRGRRDGHDGHGATRRQADGTAAFERAFLLQSAPGGSKLRVWLYDSATKKPGGASRDITRNRRFFEIAGASPKLPAANEERKVDQHADVKAIVDKALGLGKAFGVTP